MALWAFGAIVALVAAYLVLTPGAWDGMMTGVKFMTGYNEIERLYE